MQVRHAGDALTLIGDRDNKRQVALGQRRDTTETIGDKGEAMAVLELANRNHVALELRSARNVLQSVAARQRKDQLLAARDDRRGLRSRRSAAARGGAVIVNITGASLRVGAQPVEIAMPVSKPAWLVTNGNRRVVVQRIMLTNVSGSPELSRNRGSGAALLATTIVLSGANDAET